MQKKVGLISLGCPKNLVDSEVILGKLIKADYEIVADQGEAEIIVINTCGFIKEAVQESIETVIEMGQLKKTGQCSTLVVTGCLAQRYQKELLLELPEIDILIGTGQFHKITEILDDYNRKYKSESKIKNIWIDNPIYLYDHKTPRRQITPPHSAYIKIAEGCNNHCSYCKIPALRGGLRSREIDSILKEVQQLAQGGVREINLIAQDITNYGNDLSKDDSLSNLLKKLVEINSINWIRILYAYPVEFPDDLIEIIANHPKICKYIDLPIQHIDDKILKAMNRKSTRKDIEKLIFKLRDNIPELVLRTSLMVGFPGESDAQFESLLSFVKEIRFDRLGVFKYSQEEGTPAAKMKNQIPEKVKEARHHEIMKLQSKISLKKNQKLVGTIQEVLIDGLSEETPLLLEGRTRGFAPDIDGKVYINKGTAQSGDIKQVKITEAYEYDLVGEIV